MNPDYPGNLLAREPPPPYPGEGPFALWHVSEDPSLIWRRVADSTVAFSGSWLRNAGPNPQRFS